MSREIAIVEDEGHIRDNYAAAMSRYGYRVRGYADRPAALRSFQGKLPDLVVIDVGLGEEIEGGYELCREVRSMSPTVPIVFLTARDSDFDVISGLRLGADDYLSKDTSMPHLMARIVALFRRVEALRSPAHQDTCIEHGKLSLEVERMRVRWDDVDVPLTVTEFWLVHSLARYPGHVKNRSQLMDDARAVVDDSTITSHIKRIRKKFLALDQAFDVIETVHGVGYRWRP